MDLYLNGKKLKLKPSQVLGKGGEADVFRLNATTALKVFKSPDHPDYQGCPHLQTAAQQRLQEHQQKLRQFPYHLPDRVVTPQELVTDRPGQRILGYTMGLIGGAEPLLRYSDRSFRQVGIGAQQVVEIFQDLHQSLQELHRLGVILGDFNDLNILVQGTEAHLIDADSFQFGGFLCRVFSDRFLDPLLADPRQTKPVLAQPYTEAADWYAFTVMLMQCLLFVHPYGGVYRPQDPAHRLPHSQRPLQRITVFNPEVRYPKPALPLGVLPDALLHHFQQTFQQDWRGVFPKDLLSGLGWSLCGHCGLEHARSTCPHCQIPLVVPIAPAVAVAATVIVTEVFRTQGQIVAVSLQGDRLGWLYHDGQGFYRETGQSVFTGQIDRGLAFGLQGDRTLVAKQGTLVCLGPDAPQSLALETKPFATFQPHAFATNGHHHYWIHQGQLLRDGDFGSVYVGDVLPEQTYFWVGDRQGFGFYRAGDLTVTFLFDARQPGLNDRLNLTLGSGQLLDATAVFGDGRVWFFWAMQEQGQRLNRCALLSSSGQVLATAQGGLDDGGWLSRLSGKTAAGAFLFVPTDEGIVRVELHQGQLVPRKTFTDTEPWVQGNSQLFATSQGLYCVQPQTITQLKLT